MRSTQENLAYLNSYNMSPFEKKKLEEFRQELIQICDDLNVPRGRSFDGSPYMDRVLDDPTYAMVYKEELGYYVINNERGNYSMDEGFPVQSKEKAKRVILESEFWKGGLTYEVNERTTLEQEWVKRYKTTYDSRKAGFEYVIKNLHNVFNTFPEDLIKVYTSYLDEDHWYYNKTKMLFEEC